MIVLDSSALIAFHNESDVHHSAAATLMGQVAGGAYGQALLPEYVVLECTTVLALRKDLDTAVQVGEHLLASREVKLVPCSDHFFDAWDVFQRQPTAGLSFVDAAIVAIARAFDTRYVATFDAGLSRVAGLEPKPG